MNGSKRHGLRNAYGLIVLENDMIELLYQKRRRTKGTHPNGEYIVMGKYLGGYVTWVALLDTETGRYDCEHGHYFGGSEKEAYIDWQTR